MRVIIRRYESLASRFLRPSYRTSYHGSPHLRPAAIRAPWLARGLTGGSSLAAWTWNTSTNPKPEQSTKTESGDAPKFNKKKKKKKKTSASNEETQPEGSLDPEVLRKEFYSIIETGQPDQVMTAFLDYDYRDLVATMPHSVFVEALHLLSPSYFTEPYKKILRPLHPSNVTHAQFKTEQSIFDDFARNLSAVIATRRSAGHTLGLAEYTHLLDCAHAIGDAMMGDYIWHSMRRDGVEPDVQCYNHYMGAKVWDGAHTGLEKYRLRVTPFYYRKRKFGDNGWKGYGTARQSVRFVVREIFSEMTDAGHEGDEASIVNLLMASARVGDYDAIGRILKSIWNIDVDLLKAGLPDNVTEYDRTSPFYPSGHLLTALAHAYGTNNDIQAAVLTIGRISDFYDIEVPDSVWDELFEWAFVLSRHRSGPGAEVKRLGQDFAGVPFLHGLFDQMTSEPINVKPTVEMHMRLAMTAWRGCSLDGFLTHIRAAYRIMDETRRKRIAAREMVESYLRYPRINGIDIDPQILRSRGFADAVHNYDIIRTLVMQQTKLIERLAKLLVFKISRPWIRDSLEWQCRLRPQLLEEWRDFLPQQFRYPTDSGEWTIAGMTTFDHPRLIIHQGLQLRRPSLGDDFTIDQAVLDEIDDDAVWSHYANDISPSDHKHPVLKQLFDPVLIDFADYEAAADFEEESLDGTELTDSELAERDAALPKGLKPIHWAGMAEESVRRKIFTLAECFGSFPGSPDHKREPYVDPTEADEATEEN
ncbi:mitochondrial ATPase expression-domain-containing protein [Aspergillus oleicola]